MAPASPVRRHDVDALRVFATWMLFAFHAGKVFDVPPFYSIKNAELSGAMGLFTGFVHQWHMPLFFLLAGWSAYGSLAGRGPGEFVGERVRRLVVPLLFGVLVLCVPIRWVELRHGMYATPSGVMLPAEPDAGFLAFLPRYYLEGGLTWSHLWFLAYLATFSLFYLPLLARFARRPAPSDAPEARLHPAWALAPILPLALVQVTLRERWPGFQNLVDDWANFAYYSLYFGIGFALARRPDLERALHRLATPLGVAALAALAGMLWSDALRAAGWPHAPFMNRALSAVAGWGVVAFLLGFAARRVRARGRALDYLAGCALPIYVLHQLAVVALATWVVTLPLAVAAKWALLTVLSAAATLATWHLVARPVPALRFLLGAKGGGARRVRVGGARAAAASAALALLLLACDGPTRADAAAGESPPAGWPVYGGDAGGSRWSPLADVNRWNVASLEIAWTFHTGDVIGKGQERAAAWKTSFQATPILDEGTLYFPTPLGRVFALDAASGAQRWVFDTGLDRGIKYTESTSRGVAIWRDGAAPAGARCARRIFYANLSARLVALDAADGRPCADFGANGSVELRREVGDAEPREYVVTSPPAVVGDLVVVGSGIADNQRANAPRGVVRAFDARSGALRWRFDPIPTDPADPAWATWEDGSAPRTGAANAWSILSVDAARDLVLVPTGSASPDYYGGERLGANRHANSVVALRASTGQVVWSFQTTHHDLWDYDVPAQPVLVTLRRDGREIPAVVQATKMGFLFVLHRETGEPLFPVEERPVPASDVPGERASPTQPFPVAPPPLAPSGLRPEDAFGLTFWDRGKCREKIARLRREGLYTPPSLEGSLVFPGAAGGTNWGSVAFDPTTQRLYANTTRLAYEIGLVPRDRFEAERARAKQEDGDPTLEFAPQAGTPYGMRRRPLLSPFMIPCNPPPWGTLASVDLAAGTLRWESALGTTRDLAPVPIGLAWGTPNMGGPIVTAGGVVFIGAAMDDYLRAFDAESGEELWKGRLPAGGQATPMTYKLPGPTGRQLVVIAAGGHGKMGSKLGDSLVAFALPAP
jgi:quinoprotein glucose dehydrogenase